MEQTKSEINVGSIIKNVRNKKQLTILPTNQLLQQVWDYLLTRPNKKGEFKKLEHECLYLLCWKVGLRVSEAIGFDLSLEHQQTEYKNFFFDFLAKIKEEMNLPVNIELAPHTLRRCFATYQAISGMPLPVLQKVLGHSKISTTALYIKDSDLSNLQRLQEISQLIKKDLTNLKKRKATEPNSIEVICTPHDIFHTSRKTKELVGKLKVYRKIIHLDIRFAHHLANLASPDYNYQQEYNLNRLIHTIAHEVAHCVISDYGLLLVEEHNEAHEKLTTELENYL
ncbi:4968_t:CDS:2 [Entrophospora sp. SA101]|nr:9144_t:CDS:2 [Entrophospora sp. SA101]CAJ0833518.1 4968_t:CDS:2 [Entrophospora sp. SA101]